MADYDNKPNRRGSMHIREIIPAVLEQTRARVATHRANEDLRHKERRCVSHTRQEDKIPN